MDPHFLCLFILSLKFLSNFALSLHSGLGVMWLFYRHSGLQPQYYILTLTAVRVHSPVICMGASEIV